MSVLNEVTERINPIHFASIEVTEQCNLQCTHCYADASPAKPLFEMTTDQHVDIIARLLTHGVQSFQFIGGEPLLHPAVETFLSTCAEGGAKYIEVFTNLTVLTDEHLEVFKRHNVMIATSYYSAVDSVHRAITCSQVPLSRLERNIRRCIDAGLTVRVCIVRTPANTDNMDDTITHLKQMGVTDVSVDNARYLGRHANDEKADETHMHCGRCGKNQIAIATNGDLFPCSMSRDTVGNIFETGLLTAEARLMEFREVTFVGDKYSESEGGICPPQQKCNPYQSPCQPKLTCQPFK